MSPENLDPGARARSENRGSGVDFVLNTYCHNEIQGKRKCSGSCSEGVRNGSEKHLEAKLARPKRYNRLDGTTPGSAETHALGSRKVGDYEPLPPREPIPLPGEGVTLVDQILNPRAPVSTGSWSEAAGMVADPAEADRAELIAKIEAAKAYAGIGAPPERKW
jgi:hypothetical protein